MHWFSAVIQQCKTVVQGLLCFPKSLPCLGFSEEDLTSIETVPGSSNNVMLPTPAVSTKRTFVLTHILMTFGM
ncbi:hypothetical protein ASPBRDRAFT_139704 [Aspergillus brasiliensis CBS 101740]|uniref:Uncharacterized protein n=1 Tax=Aspergillus brasiliensis (strain CBS 101740 / IMI 381727 / IBT 21946) TaxID=767769 RepID=A0A1L9U1R1_ASPBC|nr:hypothetical protein ASPBRDRAFT_139704 [Aspergillus brasiliensis CBS 101740]